MRCPKCGYISFDYNQVCPKCNKNISAEQEKFFLPSFRPEPPALLGFLIGEANESMVDIHGQQGSQMTEMAHAQGAGLGDSGVHDREDFNLDEQDLEMSLEPEGEPGEDLFGHESVIESEKFLSDSDFHLDEKGGEKAIADTIAGAEEEPQFDLGDLSLEEPEGLLGELSLDESGTPQESAASALEFDDANLSLESFDSLPVEVEQIKDESESEIELNLDDLKVDDLGDLEAGPQMEVAENEMERTLVEPDKETAGEFEPEGLTMEMADLGINKLPDISELVDEGKSAAGKERTMILEDFSLDDAGTSGNAEGFEFADIPIEASASEEGALDFGDFNLDSNDSGETARPLNLDDISLNDSGELEKSFDLSDISIDDDFGQAKGESTVQSLSDSDDIDIDLDAMSLDVEEYQKKPAADNDDFVLDLEDMDIDLDLNEPKK